jgi:hypothetical protein
VLIAALFCQLINFTAQSCNLMIFGSLFCTLFICISDGSSQDTDKSNSQNQEQGYSQSQASQGDSQGQTSQGDSQGQTSQGDSQGQTSQESATRGITGTQVLSQFSGSKMPTKVRAHAFITLGKLVSFMRKRTYNTIFCFLGPCHLFSGS